MNNYRQVAYKHKSYCLGNANWLAVGVEIELPVDRYSVSKTLKHLYDKHNWIFTTDDSQVQGNIEAISPPMTVGEILSDKFSESTKRLLKYTKADRLPVSAYGHDGTTKGSGLHLHFSWDNSYLPVVINEYKLQFAIYEYLNRSSFDIAWFGKSDSCLNCYSRIVDTSRYACWQEFYETGGAYNRYQGVNVVGNRHLELRFAASHPDYRVILRRIEVLILIVESVMTRIIMHNMYKNSRDSQLAVALKQANISL